MCNEPDDSSCWREMSHALAVNLVSRFDLNRRIPSPPRFIKAALPCGDPSQQIQLACAAGKFAILSQHGLGFEQPPRLREFRGAGEPDLSKAIMQRSSRFGRQVLWNFVHAGKLPAHDGCAVTPFRFFNCFVR